MTVERIEALQSFAALLDTPQEHLLFLVEYGSRSHDADVDLLAVYESPRRPLRIVLGRLDIIVVDENEFSSLLKHHDLRASEPLLTGELVVGDSDEWNQIRDTFLGVAPGPESIHHLLARSFEIVQYAEEYLRRFTVSGDQAELAACWQNLSFAAGYFGFARHYAAGRYPLTCEQAATSFPLLTEIRHAAKSARRRPEEQHTDDISRALARLRAEMVGVITPSIP